MREEKNMTDFEWDCKVKKNIAWSAQHTKSKRGRRGCTLPCDRLTAAQLKKLNGKEVRYMLHRPISWAVFTSYPEDIQKEYLRTLEEDLRPSNTDLARMFGVDVSAVSKVRKKLGFNRAKQGSPTKEHQDRWNAWLAEWKELDAPMVAEVGPLDECVINTPEIVRPWSSEELKPVEPKLRPTSVSVEFSGVYTIADLADALAKLPTPEGRVHVAISITEEAEVQPSDK
jgi:hypothetical protein